MSQHSFTVNVVTQKSASLHNAVAMIYKNSVLSFHRCPSHLCAKPGLAVAVTRGCSVLWGTKTYSIACGRDCQMLFCHEKIKANKSAFWRVWELWCCHATGRDSSVRVHLHVHEFELLGHSAWFSHIVVRPRYDYPRPTFCNSSFTDIFTLLKSPWHERKKL